MMISFLGFLLIPQSGADPVNIVINTWAGVFQQATVAGYASLSSGNHPLDAVEIGCSVCEANQCDGSVGYGSHPDTSSHTSLDAMIMNGLFESHLTSPPFHRVYICASGDTMDVGSVGYIRRYRDAISLARLVMDYTDHTLLVGEGAESFADMLGVLKQIPASSNTTIIAYNEWVDAKCQPNFYRNMAGVSTGCGPFSPTLQSDPTRMRAHRAWATPSNHDTIGMVVLSNSSSMACGTTTNGANHKVAGRVGDSPIAGAGDNRDEDVMSHTTML